MPDQSKPETNEVQTAQAVDPATPLFGLPRSPGWYWARLIAYPAAVTMYHVHWSDHERCLVVDDAVGATFALSILPDHHWYGPLTPPQWPNV